MQSVTPVSSLASSQSIEVVMIGCRILKDSRKSHLPLFEKTQAYILSDMAQCGCWKGHFNILSQGGMP